jgi:hypothetical protein
MQQVYGDTKPVEDVVAMLKQFRSSSVPRDQEVFACMIHNLFDEYRFFPRYPDRVGASNSAEAAGQGCACMERAARRVHVRGGQELQGFVCEQL